MQDEEIIKVFSDFNFLNACGYFNPLGEINVLMEEIDRTSTLLILNTLELKQFYVSQAKLTQMIYNLSKHVEW